MVFLWYLTIIILTFTVYLYHRPKHEQIFCNFRRKRCSRSILSSSFNMLEFETPFDIPKIEFLGLFAMMLILSRLERLGLAVFCSKLYFLRAFSSDRFKEMNENSQFL